MNELRELARRLLANGEASVVIGWEEGPRGARPAFITRVDDADRLIFDHRCVHSLPVYLTRPQIKALGKPAIVVKTCDARAIAGLIREHQLNREDVIVIGVRCNGVTFEPYDTRPYTAATVSGRCRHCATREPQLFDHLVGEPGEVPKFDAPPPDAPKDRLLAVEEKSYDGRWEFWQKELARCVRCYACRSACPLCYCERCVADKTEPQWIESSPHARGNLAWHVTRALHLAGRCIGCGECERACPVDIQLSTLNRKLAAVIADRYGYTATDDPSVKAPIGTFDKRDPQDFIL